MKIKPFNPTFKLKDYLDKGEYRRSQVRFITDDLEVAMDKVSLGWSFFLSKEGMILIAPEKWIVDLTEPSKVFFYTDNPSINLAYFYFIKEKIQKGLLKDEILEILHGKLIEFCLSKGPAIEAEIRLIFENKKIGEIISNLLFTYFLASPKSKTYIERADKYLGSTRKIHVERYKMIDDYPKEVKNLFLQIKYNYSLINTLEKDLYSYDYTPGIAQQIAKEFKKADVFIFVPWGCFKYLGNFITKEIIDRVMFWEVHFGNYNISNHKFKKKSLKGKQVVILDKSYSGLTINKLAKMVEKEGGFPIKVALFPKSRLALQNADYVVFLDKLIKSSAINSFDSQWFVKLYKEILKK